MEIIVNKQTCFPLIHRLRSVFGLEPLGQLTRTMRKGWQVRFFCAVFCSFFKFLSVTSRLRLLPSPPFPSRTNIPPNHLTCQRLFQNPPYRLLINKETTKTHLAAQSYTSITAYAPSSSSSSIMIYSNYHDGRLIPVMWCLMPEEPSS
jgi:hypothetical protein